MVDGQSSGGEGTEAVAPGRGTLLERGGSRGSRCQSGEQGGSEARELHDGLMNVERCQELEERVRLGLKLDHRQ